ncbi:hypothetical protein Tco_0576834 [Tanacetum coccineum]
MWNTLKLVDSKEVFKFIVDEEEVTFSLNDLQAVLKLPQKTTNNRAELVEALEPRVMIEFLNVIGHVVRIRLAGITRIDQPPLHIMQMFYCIVNNVHVDYETLIWEGLHYQLINSTTKHPELPYPHFTNLIIDHILTKHPNIPNTSTEPYHLVANDDVVQSNFNSKKSKGRGMGIPEWLLTSEIMQTKGYKLYADKFALDVPMTQSQLIESSQGTNRTPSAPSYTLAKSAEEYEAKENVKCVAQHIMDDDINKIVKGEDFNTNWFVDDMMLSQEDPGTRIDLRSHKESLEAEKVIEYVFNDEKDEEEIAEAENESLSLDKDELKELTASKPTSLKVPSFKPTSNRSRYLQGTIARMSRHHGYMLQHMRKSFMPMHDMNTFMRKVDDTPKEVIPKLITKATDQNMQDNLPWLVVAGIKLEREKTKAELASMVADVVQKHQERTRVALSSQISNDLATNVPPQVDAFLRYYMNNNIIQMHPTSSSSSIHDLQHQLYLKTKDDEQAQHAYITVWIALKYKFKKPATQVDSCRTYVFRRLDHDDHHDDDALLEEESSVKRQKTSYKGKSAMGTSSSKTTKGSSL